jgi:hypothetical protein
MWPHAIGLLNELNQQFILLPFLTFYMFLLIRVACVFNQRENQSAKRHVLTLLADPECSCVLKLAISESHNSVPCTQVLINCYRVSSECYVLLSFLVFRLNILNRFSYQNIEFRNDKWIKTVTANLFLLYFIILYYYILYYYYIILFYFITCFGCYLQPSSGHIKTDRKEDK